MAYNRENLRKVKEHFAQKRAKALDYAERCREELHKSVPEIAEIDNELSETGIRILEASKLGKDKIEERISFLKSENIRLRKHREELMIYYGYPADYGKPKFECDKCSDSGYVGLYMCSCMKKALAEAGFESSGLGRLAEKQSFETFSLDFYNVNPEIKSRMEQNYKLLYDFAHQFRSGVSQQNWLIIGGTGLGKTHISTAVARVVIEQGNDVVYETAQNIMSDFETEKFRNTDSRFGTQRYFASDLLIIDDLGTELNTQFTVSCLYNIINTRLNNRKSMIINTNITSEELRNRYADRITSRLFGEFNMIAFMGKDIRSIKLLMNQKYK